MRYTQRHEYRVFWFKTFLLTVFVVFFARLVELQIIRGEEFRTRADENRFFTRNIPAPRGIFLDRNGVKLVLNKPEYKKATAETENLPYPKFEPVEGKDALASLTQNEKNMYIDQRRDYLFGPALSPVLGYTAEATADELQQHAEYSLGENIGKMGLERVLQTRLVGRRGREVYEMHATGKLLRKVFVENAIVGENVPLTVDSALSKKAYEVMEGRRGAVVVSDIKTGEILALVSSPSFDPANLSESVSNEDLPMMNRAIGGAYPPGSVFKLMTALTGLMNEKIDKSTEFEDTGELKVGEFTFGNWYFSQYGRKEGMVNIVKALQRSNDIFFYKVAELVGPEEIAKTARRFHFGSVTGLELPGEVGGLIPTPEWKEKTKGEQWYLGNTYHMGIGQGDILVTPLQVNQATAAIANGGTWCRPHVLRDSKSECEDVEIPQEELTLVVEGMKAACASGGTAFPFFDKKPVEVLCKTGTAEFGPADEKGRRKTHALFTLAAPVDQPQVAVTVLIEGTEDHPFLEGSRDAAPIAKEVLKAYFGQ